MTETYPIAIVRFFRPSGQPVGCVTCYSPLAIVNAVKANTFASDVCVVRPVVDRREVRILNTSV